MEKDSFQFNLITERFIVNRWKSDIGHKVKTKIIDAIQASEDISPILKPYILVHPENIEPHHFPHYPVSAMGKNTFWVLDCNDLRGIKLLSRNCANTTSLEKRKLSYSYINSCNFDNVNLNLTDFSFARISDCSMNGVSFVNANCKFAEFINCSITDSCFVMSRFTNCNFYNSDFRGSFFEDVSLTEIKVNYQTKFDFKLADRWKTRTLPKEKMPDILNSLRKAYKNAGLWTIMDKYLIEERTAQRKYLLHPKFKEEKSLSSFNIWFSSYVSGTVSGYATKSMRVFLIGFYISVFYSALYMFWGIPMFLDNLWYSILESIYFSFSTFATLGYGDLSYGPESPYLRILSTTEAWLGAIFISLYVVVLGKKIFR